MTYSIIWSPDALMSFEERIEYLKINWTEKEIINFRQRVNEYLEVLKETPFIGKKPNKLKNLHIGLIIKPVSLIYRVKTTAKEIELVLFIDNRQNPKKIQKYRG
jgi:plasmid stabilization system protein ParE